MSNWEQMLHCPACRRNTPHSFLDNTPRRHRYTVVCGNCGNKTLEDIPDYEAIQYTRGGKP